jgi:uncharacterized membrane protein
MPPPLPSSRLAYLDWMRGLACVLMFQAHCYDAWLNPAARKSTLFLWSQLAASLPAPLFLFLAGVSFAWVTDRLHQAGVPRGQIARTAIRRGIEILGLGLLFRLQEYVIAWGWAPWTDLLRVDVLNIIGVSIVLMSALCWLVLARASRLPIRLPLAASAGFVALTIALLTPPLWTTWAPRWLPWPIESYVNGVHTFGQPQAWLFPIFPWTAFAFAGLAAGLALRSGWAQGQKARLFLAAASSGVGLILLARWLNGRSLQLYAVYDFWHTSPNFFLLRLGILFVILAGAYAWCEWGAGQWGASPLVELGQTSLLVYWVHMEFVYGRLSLLTKKSMDTRSATLGFLAISLSMLLLSRLRTAWKHRGDSAPAWLRRPLAS